MFAITESWIHEHIYIYYHYYSKSQKNETNRNSCQVDRNYKMSKSFLTDDFRPRKILYSVRIILL